MIPFRTEDYHWHLPGWPGEYDSQASAEFAVRLGHEVLERLQASVNPGGVVGLGMLQRAWDGEIPETWDQKLASEKAEKRERERCSQCRKLAQNVSNIDGKQFCGPCTSRHFATTPTPCIFPGCGIKSMGGRCRAHRDYEVPLPQKDRRAALAKREMPKLTEAQEGSVDRLLGRVLGAR